MAGKAGGNAAKIGRWKRCPSNASYKAQDRCAKNRRRKATQVALQILARQKKVAERMQAGKPQRGAARKLRRDGARTAWILDDTSDHISLAKFMRKGEVGNEKTL
jgi:hypothetical protein